jgi:hypothetical protein
LRSSSDRIPIEAEDPLVALLQSIPDFKLFRVDTVTIRLTRAQWLHLAHLLARTDNGGITITLTGALGDFEITELTKEAQPLREVNVYRFAIRPLRAGHRVLTVRAAQLQAGSTGIAPQNTELRAFNVGIDVLR